MITKKDKEEALNILNGLCVPVSAECAFDMAVDALEQQPADDEDVRENVSCEAKRHLIDLIMDVNTSEMGAHIANLEPWLNILRNELLNAADELQPTRIKAPWIKDGEGYICGACSKKQSILTDYCSHCGADHRDREIR